MKRKTNLRASIAANHVTVVVAKFTEKEKKISGESYPISAISVLISNK